MCIRDRPSCITLATLASAGISCRRVSLCLSVRLSQVGVLPKRLNVGSSKQSRTTALQRDSIVFWCRKSRQNSNGVAPNGGAKCRWDKLKCSWCDWKSVANLSHVRRTAVRRARFVSDSWSLYVDLAGDIGPTFCRCSLLQSPAYRFSDSGRLVLLVFLLFSR